METTINITDVCGLVIMAAIGIGYVVSKLRGNKNS